MRSDVVSVALFRGAGSGLMFLTDGGHGLETMCCDPEDELMFKVRDWSEAHKF